MTFDSENFLSSPRVRCWGSIILFIIAAFLIFHLGVICGEHRGFRHHGFGGDQQYFTASARINPQYSNEDAQSGSVQVGGGGWGEAQNAEYYGNPSMDTQYGEAAGYSGDGAMTEQQIYQDSGYTQAAPSNGKVFIYRTQTQ